MLAARPRRPPQRRHWPFTGRRPPSSSTLPWPSRWQVGACWELRSLLRNNHFLGISTAGLRRQQTFSMYMLVESGAKVGSSFYQFVFIWVLLLFFIDYGTGQASVALADTVSCNPSCRWRRCGCKTIYCISERRRCACEWPGMVEGRRTEVALHRVCRGKERPGRFPVQIPVFNVFHQ